MGPMMIFPMLFAGAPGPPPDPGGGTPLASPYSFDAVKSGTNQINLSWTNNPLASGYEIQRRNGAGSFSTINTPVAGSTSYNDTGRSANTMYYYRFRSIGEGAYSDSDWVHRNDVTDDTLSGLAKVADTALNSKSATSTNRTNVQTFAEALAAAGCDENIVCMYFLYMGASLTERFVNIVCPDALNAAFRATAVGSNAATDAKGVKNIAAGFFVDPIVLPNEIVERPMIGFSFYLQTPVVQAIYNGNAELNIIHYTGGTSLPNIGVNSGGVAWSGSNAGGHTMLQRDNWNQVRVWQNGALKATDSAQHIDEVTSNESASAYFSANSPKLYISTPGTICGLYVIHHAFETDAKITAYNNAVAAFAAAEGFNV
jgi:hypothetical protein